MNENLLRNLLREKEGLKLEFKKEYQIYVNGYISGDSNDKNDLSEGQWHELIKDVISIANGNIGTNSLTGYLIIGASDKQNQDGNRTLYDTSKTKN